MLNSKYSVRRNTSGQPLVRDLPSGLYVNVSDGELFVIDSLLDTNDIKLFTTEVVSGEEAQKFLQEFLNGDNAIGDALNSGSNAGSLIGNKNAEIAALNEAIDIGNKENKALRAQMAEYKDFHKNVAKGRLDTAQQQQPISDHASIVTHAIAEEVKQARDAGIASATSKKALTPSEGKDMRKKRPVNN